MYQTAINGLISEARKGVRFQEMNKTTKVLLIIGLVPLIVSTFLLVATHYILLFLYKGFAAPIDFLNKVVKDESKDIEHSSKFAIYWLVIPVISFFYVLQSFVAFVFYFHWFVLIVNMYLVTLGGVRFQPLIMDATYPEDENVRYYFAPGDTGVKVFMILLIIFDVLTAINGLFTVGIIEPYEVYELYEFTSLGLIGVFVMLFIVNPILFKKKA